MLADRTRGHQSRVRRGWSCHRHLHCGVDAAADLCRGLGRDSVQSDLHCRGQRDWLIGLADVCEVGEMIGGAGHAPAREGRLPRRIHLWQHEIGGVVVRIESPVERAYLERASFRAFESHDRVPDVSIVTSIGDEGTADLVIPDSVLEEAVGSAPRLGPSTRMLRIPAVRDSVRRAVSTSRDLVIETREFNLSVIDFERRRVETFVSSGFPESDLDVTVGPTIHSIMFPAAGALLVHSSSVEIEGKVALFLAPGEGGKTTAARLARSYTVLGDDQSVLRLDERGTVMLHSTPWGGITAGPRCAPLGGIFILEKAGHFELLPAPRQEIIQYVFDEHRELVILSNRLKGVVFGLLADACAQARCFRLRFPKDRIDWHAVRSAMGTR